MRSAALDWQVSDRAWQRILPRIALPDSNDNHVLAAAIAGHADRIVTLNLRDFPSEILHDYGIEAIHPDTFIVKHFDLDLVTTLSAFKAMRARMRRPERTALEFGIRWNGTGCRRPRKGCAKPRR